MTSSSLVARSASRLCLLLFFAASCTSPWPSQASRTDNAVIAFGAKVGTLARAIQSKTVFIQAELSKAEPDLRAMQDAQAGISRAHLEQLPPAPTELYALHDAWVEASFDCQYVTSLAVIDMGGDLTACLSEIGEVVKATAKYMPTEGEQTQPTP